MRVPEHIGIIPDGNRRWAVNRGFAKEQGYALGIDPGLALFHLCQEVGVKELTFYGFTTDNVKRPAEQRAAFVRACVSAVNILSHEDATLLVVGNHDSPVFPEELRPFTTPQCFGSGGMRVNFLVNYGWEWDLGSVRPEGASRKQVTGQLRSADVSRIDLIIRWGGRRRLSGFLPVQSVYADFYIVDAFWPDFTPEHFTQALEWYQGQDITLGG
jgi:undecaprenyl diphosphate synthase